MGDHTRKQAPLSARLGTELLGTFVVTFAATGADSGVHVNPAVSLAFFFRREFSGALVAPYVVVQTELILTALLAFAILGVAEQKAVVGKNDALAVGSIVALCGSENTAGGKSA